MLLPPGQIWVAGMAAEGAGKVTKSETGKFMHTGAWVFVHDNNSIEVNMLECTEHEAFNWEGLDAAT